MKKIKKNSKEVIFEIQKMDGMSLIKKKKRKKRKTS